MKKVQREEQDLVARHERNKDMIQMLNEQMITLRAKAEEESRLKSEEAVLMVGYDHINFYDHNNIHII